MPFTKGHTTSDVTRAKIGAAARTHGHGRPQSPTYVSWHRMIDRCSNPKNLRWDYYGGRGIAVCERWTAFVHFLADMGERPVGMSIDRFPNPHGNYEPGNARWATLVQQRANWREL